MLLRRITPPDVEAPETDVGNDGPFGGGPSVTATVKGKITSLEPLRVQTEDGREVTQTQQVAVTAGARVRVDFPIPPGTAGKASSTNGR